MCAFSSPEYLRKLPRARGRFGGGDSMGRERESLGYFQRVWRRNGFILE